MHELQAELLARIYSESVPTRQLLARRAGTSHVSTNKALKTLVDRSLVESVERLKGSGGRPAEVFDISPGLFFSLGVTVGVESARCVVLDSRKNVVHGEEKRYPRRSRSGEEVGLFIEEIGGWAREVANKAGVQDRVLACGFSLPGMVDTARGIWTSGLQFGRFTNQSVAPRASSIVGVPVYVEDNSRCLARLELMTGRVSAVTDNFIVVNMGIGLGAGTVINREVFLGNRGIVAEIGHVPLPGNSTRCICGSVGCTETLFSAPAIIQLFNTRLREGVRSLLEDEYQLEGTVTIDGILKAAQQADQFCRTTLFELGSWLSDLVNIVVKVVCPTAIVVGGEGSRLYPYFIEALEQGATQKLIPEIREGVSFHQQPFDDDNEALGAALYATERTLIERPEIVDGVFGLNSLTR